MSTTTLASTGLAQPRSAVAAPPSVSVLVAAWNEGARLARCLDSLVALDWPQCDILISAGGRDDTLAVARRYVGERVHVIEQRPGQGKQVALRELLALARGEVIYLTDGDCVVPPETFRAILEPIVRGEAEVVTGDYQPYRADLGDALVFYRWSIDRAVARRRGDESEGLAGANAALTRHALLAVGGFAPNVPTGTDYHLARRLRAAGFHLRYVDAAVETEYARSPSMFVRRQARWLRNTFLLGRRFRDNAAVRDSLKSMLVGVATLGLLLTLPLLGQRGAYASLGMLALLSGRRVRLLVALETEFGIRRPRGLLLRLPYLVLLDLSSWAAPLFELLTPRGRIRW